MFKITRSGHIQRVVTSKHLRDDIPCSYAGCSECYQTSAKLEENVSIVIPDGAVLMNYISFFETLNDINLVILQSSLQYIKEKSQFSYERVLSLISDRSFDVGRDSTSLKNCYYFPNEHCASSQPNVSDNGKIDSFNYVVAAAKYYADHISDDIEIILLSDEELDLGDHKLSCIAPNTFVRHRYPDKISYIPLEVQTEVNFKSYKPHMSSDEIAKLRLKKEVFVGCLRMFDDGVTASVNSKEYGRRVYFLDSNSISRATEGDLVAFSVCPIDHWVQFSELGSVVQDNGIQEEENTVPIGCVVGILRRAWRDITGSFEVGEVSNEPDENKTGPVLFYPTDKRFPKILVNLAETTRVSTVGQRVVVRISDWPVDSATPIGSYVRTVGYVNETRVEEECLLIEGQIPYYAFTPVINACLPIEGFNWRIPDEERAKRLDCTEKPICSIDPPNCKDIDDCLHYVDLENGNFEIGVHIADVSHFVRPGNSLDLEARKRGTTVYLTTQRIDMLPKLLSEALCSLNCNVERLAFSIIWEGKVVDGKVQWLNVDYRKSIILSKASLTYSAALEMINDPEKNDSLTNSIRGLWKIAQILKKGRLDAGALTLASSAVKFTFNEINYENMKPVSVQEYQTGDTHSLVEEFMLLANQYAAQKIYDSYRGLAVLRRHPEPLPGAFDMLQETLKPFGVHLDVSSNKGLAKSLNSLNKHSLEFEKYVKIMTTRCMALANYFVSSDYDESGFQHYGLAVPIYTHFTSPIRRYADLLVHRLLAAAIKADTLPSDFTDKETITKICNNLNYRKTIADRTGRKSWALNAMLILLNKVDSTHAVVTFIKDNSIVLLCSQYGLESELKADEFGSFEVDTHKRFALVNGVKIQLFQRLEIQITAKTNPKTMVLEHFMIIDFDVLGKDTKLKREPLL
eukprot:TRINITY_DN2711_c0_g1_i1.p1 TRINITY_DN2711_c0_g1~~TRINITY_DN2711_c0_g1_i1.p1  ORF type:complete len:913 (+),score=184.00 TRINITY_DN2711_c0_g1_i1:63-2801(+)